jgi:hypothetical protein
MNYAYIVCSDKYCAQSEIVLRTLNKHCKCTVLLNLYDPPKEFIDSLPKWFKQKYVIYDIPEEEWVNKRMSSKIKRLLKMDFKHGDNVFVMDTDLFIQEDIFKIFERDFDVCYTTRGYKQVVPAPINAGFWGFKFNDRSEKFLKFYIDQMYNTTWEPYIKFEKSMKPLQRKSFGGRLDWWCDQDFLNAVYLNGSSVPFECKIVDIGPKYNFAHATVGLIGNKNYKVLHFKGGRKKGFKEIIKRI